MRKIIACCALLLFVVLFASGQTSKGTAPLKKRLTITAALYSHTNKVIATDTLLKDSLVDLRKIKVDPYFTQKIFNRPAYLPTGGFNKNVNQQKECDWNHWPAVVRCYEYDSLNRVKSMTVNGPRDTRPNCINCTFGYVFDLQNQLIAVQYEPQPMRLYYFPDGNLKTIFIDPYGVNGKQEFQFIYKDEKP
jgi:hypothetical protein